MARSNPSLCRQLAWLSLHHRVPQALKALNGIAGFLEENRLALDRAGSCWFFCWVLAAIAGLMQSLGATVWWMIRSTVAPRRSAARRLIKSRDSPSQGKSPPDSFAHS